MTQTSSLKKTVYPRQQRTKVSQKSKEPPGSLLGKYFYGIGRRKESTATVKIFENPGEHRVNGKSLSTYFQKNLQDHIVLPLRAVGLLSSTRVEARVTGGGVQGQADSIRLGIARALVRKNPEWRRTLRSYGLLTRDPRAKERKKYGLKRARRAPQWTKR